MNGYAGENDGWLSGNVGGAEPQCLTLSWPVNDANCFSKRRNVYVTDDQWASTGQVFFCPSNARTSTVSTGPSWDPYGYVKGGQTTYIILNNAIRLGNIYFGQGRDPGHWNGGKISKFNPSHNLFQDWVLAPSASSTKPNEYKTSHSGGGNVLFVDGSVAWRKSTEMESVANANALDHCNVYVVKPTAHSWPD